MEDKQSIKDQVRLYSRQLVRELDVVKGIYLDSGYTFTQCHVLFEIGQRKSANLLEIADALLLDKSNTSRTVKQLTKEGLIKSEKVKSDLRQRKLSLTAAGRAVLRSTVKLADQQVLRALGTLSDEEQAQVVDGLRLYSSALRKSRLQQACSIRRIQKTDNNKIASVIRDVMTEFGAVGEGYSIVDPEVDAMYQSYRRAKHYYLVVEKDGVVCGGGGIGPLAGCDETTCELRKMFYRPEIRGIGIGNRLLEQLLKQASEMGYKQCYLETLDRMTQAKKLYERFGFRALKSAKGCTGHTKCDRYYALNLSEWNG